MSAYYNSNIKYLNPYDNSQITSTGTKKLNAALPEIQRLSAEPSQLFSDSQGALTLYKYGSDLLLRVSSFSASNYNFAQLETLQKQIQKNIGSNARLFISTLNCGG